MTWSIKLIKNNKLLPSLPTNSIKNCRRMFNLINIEEYDEIIISKTRHIFGGKDEFLESLITAEEIDDTNQQQWDNTEQQQYENRR